MSNYEKLGASASKAGLHKALVSAGAKDTHGLFAQVTDDIAQDDGYYSFLHCDGAGTKTIVAYLNFRDTQNPEAFAGLAEDALVMNLDDIFCIGLPGPLLMGNAIARNAGLISDEIIGVLIRRYQELCKYFTENGITLNSTGGETADCGDVVRTLVVDATVAGRIKKENIVNPNKITPGDIIIGLSNVCETNSGIGSNGLTLARHSLLNSSYPKEYPEVVDPNLSPDDIYRGPFRTTDTPDGLGMTVGQALLSPTCSFAPMLAKLYKDIETEIHGVIHVTGGGLTKVIRFGKQNRYIKNNLFPTPPVFSLIQEHGNVPWKEMYQVFNMGSRIEIYAPESSLNKITKIAESFNVAARQIGIVEKNKTDKNTVTVESENGKFDYSL